MNSFFKKKEKHKLGHHISEKGLMIDKRKLMDTDNWERLTTTKGITTFPWFL